MLHVCRDIHGLAAVLSHEVAHVVAGHPAKTVEHRQNFEEDIGACHTILT
jgi:predicted Zn-dependent protease